MHYSSLEPRDHQNLVRTIIPNFKHLFDIQTSHEAVIKILRNIIVYLPEHPSDTNVFTMKMEILLEPASNKLLVGQADQAGTQSQPSSSTVPPPPTSQPAPTESTTIPPTPVTKPTSKPSSPSTVPEHQPSSPRQESDIPQTQAPTHTHEAEIGHVRNVKTGLRRRLDAKDVSTGYEDVSTGFTDIMSASEKVSSGGEHVSASQREGNAVLEEIPQTKRTKKQIREEHASLAEIARIQAEEEAKNARREELKRQDELAVKRLQEELELSVQKRIAREDISEADYAQRMVGLISQRRKLIAEQKAKAQRDKPMTQAQQRQYMATYLKNQGGWKLAQIKKLIDEELKENFEYLMRSMQRFVPMDTEKDSRKRTGVELQIESSKTKKKKALKTDNKAGKMVSVSKEKDKEPVKREEEFETKKPILRYTKRKSLARKGLQKRPESAKSGTEEDVKAYIEERADEPSSEEFPMSSIP
ncbi:hypothetical protein Tco_0006758 [Tanacetum coccineum]